MGKTRIDYLLNRRNAQIQRIMNDYDLKIEKALKKSGLKKRRGK